MNDELEWYGRKWSWPVLNNYASFSECPQVFSEKVNVPIVMRVCEGHDEIGAHKMTFILKS
jgi:hypothetical protein